MKYGGQVLRYLFANREKRLHYRAPEPGSDGDLYPLQIYVDASYSTNVALARGGWWILLWGCPILWQTHKITASSASVEHSEWKAARDALTQAEGYRLVINEIVRYFGEEHEIKRIQLWEDNLNVVNKCNSSSYISSSKLYMAHYVSFLRDFKGTTGHPCELDVEHVTTDKQLADALTKHFDNPLETYQTLLWDPAAPPATALRGGVKRSVTLMRDRPSGGKSRIQTYPNTTL